MSSNAQIAAGTAGAEQNVSCLTVLGEVLNGIGLIDFPVFQPPGTGEAVSLMTQRRQLDSGARRSVPNVLISGNANGVFASGRNQRHVVFGRGRHNRIVATSGVPPPFPALCAGRVGMSPLLSINFRCRRKHSCCMARVQARLGGSVRTGQTSCRVPKPAAR